MDGLENFQTVGRNGLHRYNNQDHAMLTGLYAARNVVLGETNDLWNVNVDQEYHEEVRSPATAHAAAHPAATSEGDRIPDTCRRRFVQITPRRPGRRSPDFRRSDQADEHPTSPCCTMARRPRRCDNAGRGFQAHAAGDVSSWPDPIPRIER